MEQIDKQTLKSASFVMAGGACPEVWDKSEGVVLETNSEGSWTHLQEFGVKGNLMCDMHRTIEYWEVI